MQSSHTCHVNKTANFKTLTGTAPGNFAVGLLSNNVLLCQTSRASRQRHRWNHRLHITGTTTVARAGFCGVSTYSSSSLSDSESVTSGLGDGDCWPAASMLLVASRGRQWCWWLAGVVSCRTSVVLEASRGLQLSYDIGGAGG